MPKEKIGCNENVVAVLKKDRKSLFGKIIFGKIFRKKVITNHKKR